MKPILTWFEDLPEPYRSQAIENFDSSNDKVDTLSIAILAGFCWDETPEDFDYWSKINDRALSGEFDKK